MSKMKKAIVIMSVIVTVGCIISIGGAYAATNYAISANKIGYSDNANLGADNVQAAIDGTCTKFSTKLNNMMEQIYPVGSIYISTSISDPKVIASTLGIGTWESYGKGKTLVGVDSNDATFSTVNKTGGSKEKNLKVTNLPSHSHTYTPVGTVTSIFTGKEVKTSESGLHSHKTFHLANTNGSSLGWSGILGSYSEIQGTQSGNHTHTVTADGTVNSSFTGKESTTSSVGSSSALDVMNPYITVYMYKRVS